MAFHFHTTCWTMVLDAGGDDSDVRRPALEELCRRYWRPLHAYVRGHGLGEEDAEDVTQSFFALLLERNLPGRAHPGGGRFRCFLLTSIRNFLQSYLGRGQALKRGGAVGPLLDVEDPELNLANRLTTGETPETAYERKWAHTLIEIALEQLGAEQAALGQADRFEVLREHLFDPGGRSAHAALAARMNLNEGGVRTALSRLRARFRDLIRAEVARLVDDPSEVDDELAHLLRVLRG
jgi:RNA polymerase sigma factor (sigma-70 family)